MHLDFICNNAELQKMQNYSMYTWKGRSTDADREMGPD